MITPPHIHGMDPKLRAELEEQWLVKANDLLQRNGEHCSIKGGGHYIKNNPLLISAIEEIRDGYFQLFHEKMKLKAEHDYQQDNQKLQRPELTTELKNIEYDLVINNHVSYERLQAPNYGFSNERAEEILDEKITHPKLGLEPLEAHQILGSVIRHSIDTFKSVVQAQNICPYSMTFGVPNHFRGPIMFGDYARKEPRPEGTKPINWQAKIGLEDPTSPSPVLKR
jgi:hypothetical protein